MREDRESREERNRGRKTDRDRGRGGRGMEEQRVYQDRLKEQSGKG